MTKKYFARARLIILILGLVVGIVLRLKGVNTWMSFLTSFSITIYLELLTLNWELSNTRDSLSQLELMAPLLTPITIRNAARLFENHPVFAKWISRHVDIAERKFDDLRDGVYKVQTHLDTQDLIELYDDAFKTSKSYQAFGQQREMLTYFLTANGQNFLRRLATFQADGRLSTITRIVVVPTSAGSTHLDAFIRLHCRLGWEIGTVDRGALTSLLPQALLYRVNLNSLDAGIYGHSYVCEATPASHDGDFSKLVWVHDPTIVESYRKFFADLVKAAKFRTNENVGRLEYEKAYEEFRTACADSSSQVVK